MEGDRHRGRPVEELGLPAIVNNALRAEGIRTIGGLTLYASDELRRIGPLGSGRVARIAEAMAGVGLYLADAAPPEARVTLEPVTAEVPAPRPGQPLFGGRVAVVELGAPVGRDGRKRRGKRDSVVMTGPPSMPGFNGFATAVTNDARAHFMQGEVGADATYLAERVLKWQRLAAAAAVELEKLSGEHDRQGADLLLARTRVTELEHELNMRTRADAQHVCAAVGGRPVSQAAAPDAAVAVEVEREIAELSVLLARAEAERDAAVRGRAASVAFYTERLRRAEPGAVREVRLRDLLDAGSMCGILDQAAVVCTMLRFTCDRDAAAVLDHDQTAASVRGRLADTLATMQEYAGARSRVLAEGRSAGPELANLRAFCADPGNRTPISAHHVALDEGNEVSRRPRMREARVLPVPPEVGGGAVFMGAHVKIGSGKPPAPRLHFFDDTAASGLLVVGWIGEHLPNVATN